MEALVRDLEYGIRMLIRTPLLSVTAALTLGLGVGATTFAYSVSYGLMVLPVQDHERLMVVFSTVNEGQGQRWVRFHDYRDMRERQSVFQDLAAGYRGTINLAGQEGPPERLRGGYVTANAFEGLGISPILGRAFQEGDDAPGAPSILLLGFETWQNRYAGDPNIIGQAVRVNGEPATIIGVMPEGFGFPITEDGWAPLRYDPTTLARDGGTWLLVWGHVREGVSREAATAELQAIARQLEEEFPEQNEGRSAVALPFVNALLPTDVFYDMAAIQMAMVIGLLLVACVNVANILLARATARERDVAVRSALGAKRSQLIRQMLAEAFVIAFVGGLVGLLFVQLAFPWYDGLLAGIGDDRPYWLVPSIKVRALVLTAGLTIAAALVAGVVPAIRASGAGVGAVLRDESRGASSLRVGRFSRGLVVAELAVSCALLVGAGLVHRSVMALDQVDLGFDLDPVMTARVGVFAADYPDPGTRNRFFTRLVEEIRSDPGTEAAAVTNVLPGGSNVLQSFRVEGISYPQPSDVPTASGTVVSPGYFEAIGIELEEGRGFLPSESELSGEPVVIVNRAFVDRYLEGNDPIGRRLGFGSEVQSWMRIVGVVSNTYPGMSVFRQVYRIPEAIYRPLGAVDLRSMTVVVRTRGRPEDFAPQLREAVGRLDANLPLYLVRPMRVVLDEAQFVQRSGGVIISFTGVVGLFLAMVGLYGVTDFSVSSRTREMGIRIALGARASSILRLVFGRVFQQLGLGAALGLALGFALGRAMSAVYIGVESWDTAVSVTVVVILGLTCIAAALPPALKALRVDPVEALKAE